MRAVQPDTLRDVQSPRICCDIHLPGLRSASHSFELLDRPPGWSVRTTAADPNCTFIDFDGKVFAHQT